MKDYLLFISYARDQSDPLLFEFFRDLEEQVRALAGVRKGDSAAYFDQEENAVGSEWPLELAEALSSAPVLVAIYAPVYFSKSYCGKEVQVFLDRRRAYMKVNPGRPNSILPVIWYPCADVVPATLADFQYTEGGFGAEYETEGLQYIKSLKAFEDQYRQFVRKFARRVVQAAKEFQLPKPQSLPAIKKVPSAFEAPRAGGGPQPADDRAKGPGAAAFVYVARPDAGSAWEWAPYPPPEDNQIGKLTFSIALNNSIKPQELVFDATLIERLDEARDSNNIVVILVDSGSLAEEAYRKQMLKYDQQNYLNCATLVIWPATATAAARADAARWVQSTFRINRATKNRIYFRDAIRSSAELREAIEETLVSLQNEIVNRAEPSWTTPGDMLPTLAVPGQRRTAHG